MPRILPFLRSQFLQGRQDLLLGAGLVLTVFCVFLRTLCPTLYWGDCGELALVVQTLGVPHPTGYPLYCLLGKAWTLLLPVGTIVWRLNVLSALLGALACGWLFGFGRVIGLPRSLALTMAGLLAFSATFWQQSLITETYTLAAFFSCLLLFLAARWRAQGCRAADLRWLAVAYGFTLTCHQTNTLFVPGFLAFVFWSQPGLLALRRAAVRRQWAGTLACALPPLLLFLYLPLRAHAHPVYNWGDVETPFAFFYHITGRQFSELMFHQPLAQVFVRFQSWLFGLGLELPWPLIALAVLGLALFWRQALDRPLAALLTWILVADVGFVINYAIYNGYIYYIPSYVVLCVCAGRGLWGAWQALEPFLEAERRPALAALAACAALLLVPLQAWAHRGTSLSGNWTCYDYGRNLLASVPPNGLLIENGDDTALSSVLYLQIAEGQRPDVTLVRRGLLHYLFDPNYNRWVGTWYADALKSSYPRLSLLYANNTLSAREALSEDPLRRLVADAIGQGTPVCVLEPAGEPPTFSATSPMHDDDETPLRLDQYLDRHYQTAPIGLVTRVFAPGQKPSDAALSAETERVWHSYQLRGVFTGGLQRDHFLTLLALTYSHGSLARARLADAQGDYAVAAQSYSNVLTLFASDEAAQGLDHCRKAAPRVALEMETPR